jgi:hypothetical protein
VSRYVAVMRRSRSRACVLVLLPHLSSTSYLSCIIDTSCKQTLLLPPWRPARAEQHDRTIHNTLFSLHFPHCNTVCDVQGVWKVLLQSWVVLNRHMFCKGIAANDCIGFRHPIVELVIIVPLAKKPNEFRFRLVGIEQHCAIVIRSRSFRRSKGRK